MSEVLIPISFFAAVVTIFYLFIRKRERLTMIEKGANPELFQTKQDNAYLIRYGIIFIGLAVGLFLGNLLDSYTTMLDEVCYLTMLVLFGGISFIVSFYVTKPDKEK